MNGNTFSTEPNVGSDPDELRDFVESAVVPLHRVGPDGTIIWANQAELDLLGYTAEEYLGRHISEFHASQAAIEDILTRLGNHEKLCDYEASLRAKNGTIKHVLISSSVYWRNGEFAHTRCFTRDITERRNAEMRVRAEHAVNRILATAQRFEDAAPKLLEAIMTSLDMELGEFWLLNTRELNALTRWLTTRARNGVSNGFETESARLTFTPGEGLPGRVWETKSPLWLPDLSESAEFVRAELAAAEDLKSAVAFPVQVGEDVFGVVALLSRNRIERDQALLDTLLALGSQIGQFIQRRRTEEQLQAEHAFRQAIENSVASGVAVCDLQGRQTYVNPAFCKMVGWTEAELKWQAPPFLYWPDDEINAIQQAFQQTLDGQGSGGGFELRFQRRDGSSFDALVVVSPLTNDAGHTSGWLASVTDISVQKRNEQAQRLLALASAALTSTLDHEKTLRALARLSIEHVADWCIIDVFEGATLRRLAVEHRDPAKIELAKRFQEKYPPDLDAPRGPAAVLRTGNPEFAPEIPDSLLAASAKGPEHLEVLRSLGLRSYICVPLKARNRILGTLTLVLAESGRRYQQSDLRLAEDLAQRAAIALDNAQIYESAQQEIAERKRAELALKESQERLKHAMAAAQMGAWQWDVPSGKVIWSHGLEQIHGRQPGSFKGTVEAVMEDCHPDDIEALKGAVEQALSSRQDLHVQYRIILPDRSIRWLESHGKLEVDSSGQPLQFRGTCMNITERKKAEQVTREIESSRALTAGLLHGQEQERRRLARELHDDFTQRIVVLSMEAGRLREQISGVPEAARDLDKVSEKLGNLAEDIRDVSHRLHPSHLDHMQLAGALRAECEAFAERENIEVSFSAAKTLPEIPAETRLVLYRVTQEAFQNIARHAKAPQVKVALENVDSGLTLQIQDNGVGFAPTAQRRRQGLGLISMKERVRSVGGTLRINSQPGQGTTVSVFVALAPKG